MTIDEAIAMMHEWADYECYNEEQIQASEAFNQIAEWLEELKIYQQHEIICNKGYNAGYNKAIDDFMKSVRDIVFDYYTNEAYIKYDDLCKIAEQFKGRWRE